MPDQVLRSSNPEGLIPQIHALIEGWEGAAALRPAASVETLTRLRLAAHEWLANLAQHAAFGPAGPDILFQLQARGSLLTCMIEDNSGGFDLDAYLDTVPEHRFETHPERGMGLLMLRLYVEDLQYRCVGESRHQLTFSIETREEAVGPLSMPASRAA